ncbi:MAG: hypothetical protein PHR35_19620 [Kiritimatiellae bacterium]|nr:hypothetical protein [Kiritimatiellia bacterium]
MKRGARFWRHRCAAALAALAAGWLVAAPAETDRAALLRACFRYRISQQTVAQLAKLAESLPEGRRAQVEQSAQSWQDNSLTIIREDLDARFGARARAVFGDFLAEFGAAENKGDQAFLNALAEQLGWDAAPSGFEKLRLRVVRDLVPDEVATAGRFLGDVQSWADLCGDLADAPPLTVWLERDKPSVKPATAAFGKHPAPARQAAGPKPKPNPLRDAEAAAGDFEETEEPPASALDSFGDARGARRARALEDAQEGMQQVALERRTAEEEQAAKKTAAAQAEAEAVRKQAERLAAVEQEAIEQRKNSWSGRLKSLLCTTIGATSGAFLGGVGARAGEEAAEAVFGDH